MADSIPSALRRALAGAAAIAALLGTLHYRVGIPANAPVSLGQHVALATQATGGIVAAAIEPLVGPLHLYEGKTGVLTPIPVSSGRSYRAPTETLLLVALGNMLLLMPLFYLFFRARQRPRGERDPVGTPPAQLASM